MSKTAWDFGRKVIGKIKLTPNAKLALLVLAYRHFDVVVEENYLRMSETDLARAMGVNRASAHRAVSELVDKGVIIVVNEHKRGKRTARTYRFPADFDVPGLLPPVLSV